MTISQTMQAIEGARKARNNRKCGDNRITYKAQAVEVNGNINHFDGKGDKESKTLKVYRWHGDINQSAEGMQGFAIGNGYETVITEFSTY